jgi:hypothetical protein
MQFSGQEKAKCSRLYLIWASKENAARAILTNLTGKAWGAICISKQRAESPQEEINYYLKKRRSGGETPRRCSSQAIKVISFNKGRK